MGATQNNPFEYAQRWPVVGKRFDPELDAATVEMLDQRDRDLEDFLGRGGDRPYATIVVAPSNCQAIGAENADFVLPGGDDTEVFNEAINASWSPQTFKPGKVLILDGDVYLSGPTVLAGTIEGMGADATRIHLVGSQAF